MADAETEQQSKKERVRIRQPPFEKHGHEQDQAHGARQRIESNHRVPASSQRFQKRDYRAEQKEVEGMNEAGFLHVHLIWGARDIACHAAHVRPKQDIVVKASFRRQA